jgi:hypothetical protein
MPRLVAAAALLLLSSAAMAGCPPPGQTADSLLALKTSGFEVEAAAERRTLAFALLACLGEPDPRLRDGVAYEALAHWMRAGAFDADTLRALRDRLLAMLEGEDAAGFRKPFAALVLAEMARTDRIAPWMDAGERGAMVDAAAAYVESVRDYRGYDDHDGWRHGVAHGADWLMQLALNPALGRAELDRLLAAAAAQVVPAAGHAYVFGEPARLARPVLFVAMRDLHGAAEWQAWFTRLGAQASDPANGVRNEAWLARRHDLVAFLSALHLAVEDAGDRASAMAPALAAAIKALP